VKNLLSNLDQLIELHIGRSDFSIDFICSELGTSRSNLHRKLKSETDLSISLYIRKKKLEKAKELVENSDLNFSEIGYEVGINNPQNFSKYFHQEFGMSPTAFRRSSRDSILEIDPVRDIEEPIFTKVKAAKDSEGWSTQIKIPLIIAIIIIIGIFIYQKREANINHIEEGSSIAVLPFSNLNEEGSNFFSDGVMEDILTNLSKLPDLRVISRTSSILYRNTDKSIKQIGEELDVGYILEGSVRQVDHKVKITVQLIDAESDYHIWAESYNRNIDDIFDIQADVSKEIAEVLHQKLSSDLAQSFDQHPTSNMEAYNTFLIGRELIHSRTQDGLREGLKKMNAAIGMDPDYADAYAFKSLAYNLLGNLNYESRAEMYPLSRDAAQRALALDSRSDMAYLVLGSIHNDEYEWQKSIELFEKALKINPNSALGHYWYSLLLREIGELEKAATYSQKAFQMNPLIPVITAGHVANCTYLGDFSQARKVLDKAKAVQSNSFLYYWAEALYFERSSNLDQAIAMYEKALEINPNVKSLQKAKYYLKGQLGKVDEVQEFLKTLEEDNITDPIVLSVVYSGIGDKESSLKYLLLGESQGLLPDDLYVDSRYDLLRDEPGFKSIIRKYGYNGPFYIE